MLAWVGPASYRSRTVSPVTRRLLALLLFPLALCAGATSVHALFQCAMDGARLTRCCCPETWAEASDTPAFHRAPCCEFETLTLASQAPTPPSAFAPHVVPVVVAVPLHPFAPPPLVVDAEVRAPSRAVAPLATGPPIYLRTLSLLC